MIAPRFFMRFLSLCLCFAVLTACDLAENHMVPDRAAEYDMQDYRDALAPRQPEIDEHDASSVGIPDILPYVETSINKAETVPLVSISVNQTIPLRDVLFELAQQADYDLELDPRIRGSIIFTARERPFDQVIQRISELAGLRYKIKDGVIRVELDTPYAKTYNIDYLSYIRSNSGSVSNSVSVVSGGGADAGSSFAVTTASEADFWGELDFNLQQILNSNVPGAMRTNSDPSITAVDQNPDVEAVVASSGEDGEPQVNVATPNAVLRVDSLPTDPSSEDMASVEARFSINRHAGLVNIFATEKQHKEVREYLSELEERATAQVLIEAKILEVELNDNYQTGIDWGYFTAFNSELGVRFGPVGDPSLAGFEKGPDAGLVFSMNEGNTGALINAMSEFGTVRALSSPRMTVLNNQAAVLNVATNYVYFEIDIDRTTTDTTTTTDVESSAQTVPLGILLNVQPSINLKKNTVTLALRPTITTLSDEKNDPAVQFVAGDSGLTNLVPEVSVQEMDSVIKVNSGQAVVMGGLLEDRVTVSSDGVPVLNELPGIGKLFKNETNSISKTEIVIFLEATILNSPADSIDNADKDLYRLMSQDRRPFKL